MVISQARIRDSGLYTCKVKNQDFTPYAASYELTVGGTSGQMLTYFILIMLRGPTRNFSQKFKKKKFLLKKHPQVWGMLFSIPIFSILGSGILLIMLIPFRLHAFASSLSLFSDKFNTHRIWARCSNPLYFILSKSCKTLQKVVNWLFCDFVYLHKKIWTL